MTGILKYRHILYMKGGSLKPQEIRDYLQASYEKDAPMNIDGYV